MKKLFSTMLAATMVAGMGVTAFAYNADGTNWTTTSFGDNDYGLIGAYNDDGEKIKDDKNSKLDSGDKIYYPILISGDELDKDEITDAGNANKMYFATKASEIDDLKASVKDEVGGKYIDNAAIVKKNINIDKAGETAGKFDNFEDITVDNGRLNDLAKAKDSDLKVTGTLVAGEDNNAVATAKGVTAEIKTADAKTEDVKTIEIKGGVATAADSDKITAVYTEADNKIVFTINNTWDGSSAAKERANVGVTELNKALTDAGVTVTAGEVTVAADGTATEDTTVTAERAVDAKTAEVAVKVIEKRAEAGKKDSAGSVSAEYDSANKVLTYTVTGANDFSAVSAMGKIYCVEVEMSDYFKNEETEVEFNIKLKDSGRTEFDTDDDDSPMWDGTFDLGSDSEKFDVRNKGEKLNGAKLTKFKKGDLEIEIGEDTTSLQLDEVINKDGKDEDVDNIYIENDKTIDNAFTFDVKASGQDDLYLELNQDAVKDLAVSNQKADLTFFNFPGEPEFDFSGDATFAVEDEDEDNYFYEIVDGELVDSRARYDSRDGVFKLRTNKLGSYVISDRELDTTKAKADEKVDDSETKPNENGGGDPTAEATATNGAKPNANTGAADLIGVASAVAVVSIAAAGVVALKK